MLTRRNGFTKYQIAGYTLLEMLLVVAVVGILATLAITQVKKYSDNTRINKVSTQFQHVFEAAMAYQVKNSEHDWPPNFITEGGVPDKDFIEKYLPNQNYTSAFGHEFFWIGKKQDGGNPNKLVQVSLFTVYTKITGEKAGATAKQIAGRLPNAVAVKAPPTIRDPLTPGQPCQPDDSVCYVSAAIPTPAAVSVSESNLYRIFGHCTSTTTSPQRNKEGTATCTTDNPRAGLGEFKIDPVCPKGTEPSLSASINASALKQDDVHGSHVPFYLNYLKKQTCANATCSVEYEERALEITHYNGKIAPSPCGKGCSFTLHYIITCLKSSSI